MTSQCLRDLVIPIICKIISEENINPWLTPASLPILSNWCLGARVSHYTGVTLKSGVTSLGFLWRGLVTSMSLLTLSGLDTTPRTAIKERENNLYNINQVRPSVTLSKDWDEWSDIELLIICIDDRHTHSPGPDLSRVLPACLPLTLSPPTQISIFINDSNIWEGEL